MHADRRAKRLLRFQNLAFLALFVTILALLAWLSTVYVWQWDWSAAGRNTLSADSLALLAEMEGPVSITAYASEDETLRGAIRRLVARYRRHKDDLTLTFVNPDARPERVREQGVTMDGELVVAYAGRSERVTRIDEQSLTTALLQTARRGERWVVWLAGHGERDPLGAANHDHGRFGRALQRKGLQVRTLSLTDSPVIPENTHVLVVADPRTALLPGEAALIRDWVAAGGNLLWLREPGPARGLAGLAEDLGVESLPGVVVDATTRQLGIEQPDFALVAAYPPHPVTRSLESLTLFPHAAALAPVDDGTWRVQPLLTTRAQAWTETGAITGEIRYDAGSDEQAGPLDLGLALTRARPDEDTGEGAQRAAVLGDADFLANSYLGNGANLDLGLALVEWLTHDDRFISIQPRSAPDRRLELGPVAQAVIGFGFLLALPLALAATGVVVWLRRRRR